MISTTAPLKITRSEFRDISAFLHVRTGIRMVPGKEALVVGRLDKRLRTLGVTSYSDYLHFLSKPENEDEVRCAIDLLTTNETYFFREKRQFDFLGQVIAPAYRADRPFRLWSAASSSGEEAYTAAMVLAEKLPRNAQWEIVGTDISSRVVRSAQLGVYPISATEKIPGPLLRKYCRKGRDEYEGMMAISRELRSRVTFVYANLMEDLGRLGRFDVILLRNVMIYFDGETRIRLISQLLEMLRPGGHLVVGLSETLNGITSRLRLVEASIYQLPGGDGG